MKRIFLSALTCLLLAVTAHASNVLVLHWTSGVETTYVLTDDQPVMTFQGDSIVVTTKTSESRIDMTKVSFFRYVLDGEATAIGDISTGTDGVAIHGNRIDLSGLPAGSAVNLYDTAGKLYKALKADADGRCTVSIDDLARGVYIIRAWHVATKISKK